MRRVVIASLAAVGAWRLRPKISRVLRTIDRRSGLFAPHGAALYARVAPRILRPLYRRIAADVAGLANGHPVRVLDVGSGPGDLALEIAARVSGASIVGVDLAPAMVILAQGSAAAAGLGTRIRFELADAARLPLDDASVDLVVSSLSLHHWDRPPAVFAELHRVLRPGGSALVYDLAAIIYSTTELAAILGDAGWAPVRSEPVRFGRLRLTLVRRIRLDRPA